MELMSDQARQITAQFVEAHDPFMSVEEIADLCLKCAFTLVAAGRDGARHSELRAMLAGKGDKWQKLPKGWTDESRKKMWDSLVGDVKHKVTKCIKQMEGKVDDPGAFCAALADRVEGKEWRERDAKESIMSDKQAHDELIEATEQFKAMVTAADPFKAVHAKATDLKTMVEQIGKDASEGKYAALDNWARKTGMLEAKCRLLVKALKAVEGATPPGKR